MRDRPMSFLGQPSLKAGDDLDNLLRAFFQAEMPTPWPTAPEPPVKPLVLPARPAASRLSTLTRSRLALAASVALLISGPLFLAGKLQDTPDVSGRVNTTAADLRDPQGPKNYRSTESLNQKADGTYIQLDIFELPPSK